MRSCKQFDSRFYASIYSDEIKAEDPLQHYTRVGRNSAYYSTEDAVLFDARIIGKSGLFDADYYNEMNGARRDPIYDYLINCWRGDLKPNRDFDADFFQLYYARSVPRSMNAFVFYCRHARLPWCFSRREELAGHVSALTHSELFDAEWFKQYYLDAEMPVSALDYYCTEGFRLMMDPSPFFSTRAYLMQHKNIAASQMNPLYHYVRWGRSEGRRKFCCGDVKLLSGTVAVARCERKTVLVVCHEASLSGAPVVGLNIVKSLSRDYRMVVLLMKSGSLESHFIAHADRVYLSDFNPGHLEVTVEAICRECDVTCAILNSIATAPTLELISGRGIPCVSLVHEFSQYLQPGKFVSHVLALSHSLVVPAQVVAESVIDELRAFGYPRYPRNLHIIPQGQSSVTERSLHDVNEEGIHRLIGLSTEERGNCFVVLGVGSVKLRKGVDLFIETARVMVHEFGLSCRFVWVGDKYQPGTDYSLSVYIADQIRRSGLHDVVVMLSEQVDLLPFWQLADTFFLPSRLDPYPNVALDAIAQGIPVVCFDQASGISELAHRYPESVTSVPYVSAFRAAEALAAILKRGTRLPRREIDEGLKDTLSFDRYILDLKERIEDAVRAQRHIEAAGRAIRDSDDFDPLWMHGSMPSWLRSDNLGLAANVDGLALIAAKLEFSGFPAASLRQGRVLGEQHVGSEQGDAGLNTASLAKDNYRRLSFPSSQSLAEGCALLSASDEREFQLISEWIALFGELRHCYVLIDESLSPRRPSSLIDENPFLTIVTFSSLHDLRTTVTKILTKVAASPLFVARPSSDDGKRGGALTDLTHVMSGGFSYLSEDPTLEMLLVASKSSDSEERGNWRAAQRRGAGIRSSEVQVPLAATVELDAFFCKPNGTGTVELVASFVEGTIYKRNALTWMDRLNESISTDAMSWAVLDEQRDRSFADFDVLFGRAELLIG